MNKELLVVDDNSDIRFLICSILKEKGFKNTELRKDLFGNDRMIKALKKIS